MRVDKTPPRSGRPSSPVVGLGGRPSIPGCAVQLVYSIGAAIPFVGWGVLSLGARTDGKGPSMCEGIVTKGSKGWVSLSHRLYFPLSPRISGSNFFFEAARFPTGA